MITQATSPIGAHVTDLDLNELDAHTVSELTQVLAEHGVVVLPGQDIDDTAFAAFLARFGRPMFSVGETPVLGYPDLNVISNVGRTRTPRSVFHVDTSYVHRPPTYTALRAVRIPTHGGETLFTNQYQAFDTLPSEVKTELAGRTITHVATGVSLSETDESTAEHPVFSRHPVSGRTALYLSTPQRCVAISGFDQPAGTEMIQYLYEHSIVEGNTYRHAWSPGDVVIWDNRCVLHRADHSDVVGDRVMHRGMVVADPGVVDADSGAA